MTVERRTITSRDEWLQWRQADVTGSAAAALIGAHDYLTALQLYLDKAGVVSLDGRNSPAMRRGRLMESVALEVIKEMHPDWNVRPANEYLRAPAHRIGATPDFYASTPKPAVIEAKSVEPGVFARTWVQDDAIVPPLHAAVQVLLAKHLAGADVAYIAALRVGHGVELDLIEVPETPGLIERIEKAADAFWLAVERREPPPPDFARDAELVLRMHRTVKEGSTIDLSGNNRLPLMLEEHAEVAEQKRTAEKLDKALKAELVSLMGDAEAALYNGEVVATAKIVQKKAEEKPRAAYSFRDIRFRRSAA